MTFVLLCFLQSLDMPYWFPCYLVALIMTHLEFIYFVLVVLLPIIGTIISAKAP